MRFNVYIKSGTCGHFDYDNCDLLVAELKGNIPCVHDTLVIDLRDKYYVTEVVRNFVKDKSRVDEHWLEYITVYVIKI